MHPVLLVHGINDTGARFDKMRTALRARGFGHVHAMNITPPDASITLEAMGQQVSDGVRACQEETGTHKVDVVAFSMGALATRHYLHDLDGLSSVRRFVSVSGPHHGTLTAYLDWKIGTRQMRPGSRFLQDLDARDGRWGDVAVSSFWTPFDLVVVPATSSVLEGAYNQSFRVALHHQMLSDDDVIDAVIQSLEFEDRAQQSRGRGASRGSPTDPAPSNKHIQQNARRVANVSQVFTVDRSQLTEPVCQLSDAKLELILSGIDVVVGR